MLPSSRNIPRQMAELRRRRNGRYFTRDERLAALDELVAPIRPHWGKGLTMAEIADRLGWTKTTLQGRIQMHRREVADSWLR